jgi:hypothetical protein
MRTKREGHESLAGRRIVGRGLRKPQGGSNGGILPQQGLNLPLLESTMSI